MAKGWVPYDCAANSKGDSIGIFFFFKKKNIFLISSWVSWLHFFYRIQCGAVIMWWIFSKIFAKRHPIVRLSGRGIGCLFWGQPLIDIPPQFLQWRVQYHVILDHVITALDCVFINYHTRPCAYQWFQGCGCKVCEMHRLKVKWQKRTG